MRTLLRRTLITLAALIAIALLFYAEEDWRGKRAWENFKREWEVKGEKFDLQDFIPKFVPDDQNFALTPILATSYEWMLDKYGHELNPLRTNVVQRLWMGVKHYPPGDTVSRIEPTNGDWRIGRMCDLNSWQMYYRTPFTNEILVSGENSGGAYSYWEPVTNPGSILTNDFAFPPTPKSPAADVLLALSKYDSDIEELRAASRLTNSRFPLNYDARPPQEVYLMHLASLKLCCQTLQLRAVAELENGQSQKALDDVMLSLRLVDSVHTEPFINSHHTRSEMANMIIQVIWEGLAKHKWSDAQLSTIGRELGNLDFLADCQLSLRYERSYDLAWLDYASNLRSYHETRKFIRLWADPGFHSIENEETKATFERKVTALAWFYYLMPKGWYYQIELVVAENYQRQILQVIDPAKHLFSSQKLGDAGKIAESLPHHDLNFLARRLGVWSAFFITRKLVYAQETIDLASVACALERYQLAHGAYPENLDVLAPQYIEKVPHDIIGGQPLHYRRTPNERFLLYSVGWNEKDDGGVNILQEHSTYFVDDDKSDWVWKY